jgi:hypothetical protein
MATIVTPQNIIISAGGTATFTASCSTAIPGEPLIAVSSNVNICTISGIGPAPGPVTFTITALPSASGWCTITVTPQTDTNDAASITVSVAPSVTNIPTGYTAQTAIQQIRLRANEPNLPVDSDVVALLNAGVENIERILGGIRLMANYPTSATQTFQALSADVQDIISCNWSTGPVTAQGSLVYPMYPMDQAKFMDFAAGFPAVGFGPPTAFFLFQDTNGQMAMQLYPAAMKGFLNVYYRARPQLFQFTAPGSVNYSSTTNLDSSMQEAMILWTVARVLENRGRGGEAKSIFEPQLAAVIDQIKETVAKRSAPKFGTVRDIVNINFPNIPWFWGR